MLTLSAHGRNGAFVSSFPLSGGEGGRGSVLIKVGRGFVGVKVPPVVIGMLLLLLLVAVGTGLKPDGLAPITGMVAVGVKEKIGAGNAMLNLGSDRSTLAGGEKWSGDSLGGVRGPKECEVTGIVVPRLIGGGGRTFGRPS